MALTQALRARLLSLLRPCLREDPSLELKLGFLSSTGAAKDLLLDPSPLNPLIEGSTRLMFKRIKIADVRLRLSPWSSPSVTLEVRGVDVILSPREIAEGGRPVSVEELAEREMQEVLAAIDPEGVAVHEMIRNAISAGWGMSHVAMALRDSLLQRLQIRFQDVSFKLDLTEDSYYCLIKASEFALGPQVPSRGGLLGGVFGAFFGPWREILLAISCHAFEFRIHGNELDECLAFVKDSCVGISLSGSDTPGFYVHIPRAKVGFMPSQVPVLVVISHMLSPEERPLSRSGRDLWKLATRGVHRLKSHPRALLLKVFGTSVAWVRYVRAYKALISLARYHHKKGVPAMSVKCLSGMRNCLHRAAHELNVIHQLEKKLPPVAVARARRIARNSILSNACCCNMQWTEHLRIISLWNLVALILLLCKLIFYILYWISHIFLPLWSFWYFFGGKVIPSSPLSCFHLLSHCSPGCVTIDLGDLDVRVSHSPVNRQEDIFPMPSNFIFLSFCVSIKSLLFTRRKDTQSTYLILGKLQVHLCSKSSTSCNMAMDEESPCGTGIKSHVILWCEQALHYLPGKASDSAKAISGICEQILENSSSELLSDWGMILSEMKEEHPEYIVHPFALCRHENLTKGTVSSNDDGLLKCDLMVGRIHLSLGFDSMSSIYLLVMEIRHSLYAIEESSVPLNSVSTSENKLLEPEEYLDYYTTKMKMVMLDNIFKRRLHIIAVMGGTDLKLLMEQNDLETEKGVKDGNIITQGQGCNHFSVDLRAFEIAIWPASKDAMCNLGIDLEFNELPECLWLVEPRLAPALPQSKSSIFSYLFHVRQNIFLNFGNLAASWKNSGDDQKYPVLGPISVTICSSTSRNTYLSFSTVANALSMASRGTTAGATAFLFIDELGSMFQALESMYSSATYAFVKGDSILAHKELIRNFLSRAPKNSLGKNVLHNNVTSGHKDDNLVLENTSFATEVSFDMRSLDVILGHSRNLKFTGKSHDSFSGGSFYPDSIGDLSNSSLGIFFQKSNIKIAWDSRLLNVFINFSGVKSSIFRNQSGRGILTGILSGKSSESQQFEQPYYFSFSASKFGFFAGHRGIELAARNADSSSGYTSSINSEISKPVSVLGGGLEACSFSGENELPSSLNPGSDSWASLCVVLGDIIIVSTEMKNLVTAMQNPSGLELSLSISGEPPEINCEAKRGNHFIETSALVAFINYFRAYSICLADLLLQTHYFLERSKKAAVNHHHNQSRVEDVAGSDVPLDSPEWKFLPALAVNLSCWCLTFSVGDGSGGIWELKIEIDASLKLLDLGKRFLFDVSRFRVLTHHSYARIDDLDSTSYNPIPSLSSNGSCYMPLHTNIVAESAHSIVNDTDSSHGWRWHSEKAPENAFSESFYSSSSSNDNCILAHLTASIIAEKLFYEGNSRQLSESWVGNGFIAGFDLTMTLVDIEMLLLLAAPFSDIASMKIDNDWNESCNIGNVGPNNLGGRIADGAIVAIQDIHEHMYFAVEKVGIKYRVVGTLHYSLLGEKALFRIRYHNQKRWWSRVSLFSLASVHAKNDIGEPLRLNCSPGSSFVEVSSSDDKRWALWEACSSNRDNYYSDGGPNFYDTSGRKAFHMVNSKNDCGVAFVDGLPEFVKKPGNLFKMKVLCDYDLLSDVRGLSTSHPYNGSVHQNYSDSADVTNRTRSFNSLSITVNESTWTILHEPPNSKDKFPIFRGFISNFNIVGQSFPTKFRVLSTISVALFIFDAQRNLWRELILPIDISVFFRCRYAQNNENSAPGIPKRLHFSLKQVDISLSELSVDVLLFFAEKLNIVGPYSVKKSAIFANLCKVENHSKLNLICHFSNGDEVIISGKQSASLGLSTIRGNQLSREELSVSLSLSELGGFSTSPIEIPLSREHFFAWRTRVASVSDSRLFPGPFIIVEVCNKEEDGLCLVISSLLRIHNESGFSLKLRFQRPNETDLESVSVLLRNGDTIDESRAAFDAFNFSGGMKRALMSLSLGNFLLSVKPDVTEFPEESKKTVSVQWSDDLKGGKAIRVSGIFDKLNYRFRKALRMESVKSFFTTVQCPVTVEGVHASDLYFLIHTIAKDVPVMSPQDVGDSSKPLAFQVQKEFYVFPTIKISNLLQSEIVILLTENHPDLCVTEGCNNFWKEAKIPSGSSANLYVNPDTMYFTVTISALNSKCNPVNSGDSAKKLNKQNRSNHFDIDLNFDGGKYSAVLRLSRGEQGILEATIFTTYTLHNNTEISLLCFSHNQRIKSCEEQDPKDLSLNFGVLLPPKSSISWFFKSNKLRLKWFEEKSSGTFLDLDAISGVAEVSVMSQTQTGSKQIAKLGVSLAPYVIKQPVPSQLVDIVPRYIVSNESRFTICMRQCHLEDDSDGMTLESRQKVAFYMQDHPFKMRETSFVDSIFRKHQHGTEDSLIFIQFCIKNIQSSWSGPICIASLGRFCVKFKKLGPTSSESSSSLASDIESTQFAGVHVVEEGSSLVMHFCMPPDFDLPYRIENRLKDVAIVCHQKDSAVPEMLGPGTSAGYAWDDLSLPHKLVVQIGGINMLREINIDKVRPWKLFFKIRKSRGFAGHLTQDDNIGVQMTEDFDVNNVGFEVYAYGITRILRICKFSESSIEEKALAPRMSIQFNLRSLALSFLQSIVKDYSSPVTPEYSALIVLRLTSVTADMVSTGQWTYNYLKVLSINVDEKWQGAPFASMIRRNEQSDSGIMENILYIAAIINTGSAKVKQVKYSSIVLQPIDVNIDEETLMRLVKFWRRSLSSSGTSSTLFYFEHFEIHPIKILASFLPGNELSNYSSTQEALRSLLHNVIKVPTVKNASVELNGVLVTHALLTSRELLIKCAQHYSWYILRAIYKAKGSQLLPPAFASIFDDTASSSLDVFFDPSDGSINFPGLTLGMFKFISRCINSKGFSGSKRYLGDLGKTVKRVGSNAIFAAITEISDSVLRGAETNGFNGLATGFHQGLLHLAMEPAKIGIAAMKGGPERIVELDHTPGIDEQYIEGYLQAMLDATYKQEYLRVKVHDNQVFLKNLPPSTTLVTEIIEQVKSFLVSKGLLIGGTSLSLNSAHRLRGETDWKIGPTVLTLCEHLFVSFAIRALRNQTRKLLGSIKFTKKIGGQEEDQAPSEASRGSQLQPGRLWAVGRFALSGMLAYIDGRLCRHIPHPIARRIVSGFLLSFLEKKDGE